MYASRHIRVSLPSPRPKFVRPVAPALPKELVEQARPPVDPLPSLRSVDTLPPAEVTSAPPLPLVPVPSVPPPTMTSTPPLVLPSPRSVMPRQLSRQLLGVPDPTNTHSYDGAFREDFKGVLKTLSGSSDEKGAIYAFLRALVALVDGDSEALKNLNLIIDSFHRGTADNYDPTSEVDASEILYSIGLPLKTLTKELVCQLADISTGPCPQGRVNRLTAVLRMMRDPSFYSGSD